MSNRLIYLFALAGIALAPNVAKAGKYDIDLAPLATVDGSGSVTAQDNAAFRSLSSELGVLTALKPVDPGDSLGLSGFAVSADVSINTISGGEAFWADTTDGADNVAPTLQVMGRKGLWPGLEVGGGATHVFDSKLWTLGGYAKIALHEGFHHLPIPTFALRAHFGQLLGSRDVRMSTVGADLVVSHVFGIGNTLSLTPYAGYQALMIFSRSGVVDGTPNTDELVDPNPGATNEFVFERQDLILRHRPFVGMRLIFSVIRFGFDAMFVPGGGTEATVDGVTVKDSSGFQQQYTFTVGLDF